MSERTTGMGGHQSAAMGKDEWLTPPEIIRALGPFDLDPCSPAVPPWPIATRHYTRREVCTVCLPDTTGNPSGLMSTGSELSECRFCDGLAQPWTGRVWLNPPYGTEAARWLERLAAHGDGIALIFARTETAAWVEHVWGKADAILFIAGRLHFHHVDGTRAAANAGAPSALVAYGLRNADWLRRCGIAGAYVPLDRSKWLEAA